jgi:hypothetical protein
VKRRGDVRAKSEGNCSIREEDWGMDTEFEE